MDTLLSMKIFRRVVDAGRLEAPLPGHALPAATLYALYASRGYLSPKVRTFVDFLAEHCAMSGDECGDAAAPGETFADRVTP